MDGHAELDVIMHVRMHVDRRMYLSGFLRSFYPHHVVSDELLKELHLGNAEVEIQTAGHVHLQRVATHHHLLETWGRYYRGREEGDRKEARKAFNNTSRLFVTSYTAPFCLF